MTEQGLVLPEGLELQQTQAGLTLAGDGMTLTPDFADMLPRVRAGALARELLVRAAKVKAPTGTVPLAVDATAGLGEDSFLLAAADFEVLLFERDPVIAALLADALERARRASATAEIAARMTLVGSDSTEGLCHLDRTPDVVYLDPMFPERRKSAAVRKKFQLLHHLEHPCDDAAALMEAALASHPKKIVVKRPVKGPHLAGVKPSYSLAGKAVRYDVIVPAIPKNR